MADEFQNYEDGEQRATPERSLSATFFRRTYNLPWRSSILPAVGAVVALRDYTVAGSGFDRVRVHSISQAANGKNGSERTSITFYQLNLYSGTTQELAGSRVAVTEKSNRSATRLMVSADGSTGLPAIPSVFPGDSSDKTGRWCVSIGDDTSTYPGLRYHVIQYAGFVYSSGAEVAYSRVLTPQPSRNLAQITFVSTDGSTGIPAVGTAFPGDATPLTARYCLGAPADTTSIPGLYIHTASYAGVVIASGAEVAYTRSLSGGARRRTATIEFASVNGTTGVPVKGTAFPSDSGVTGRYAQEVTDDVRSIPGIHLHVASYVGVNLVGATAEVLGERKYASMRGRRRVTTLFASTDGTTGIPVQGDAFSGDSGVTGRYVQEVGDDTGEIYGLRLHPVTYEGYLFVGSTNEVRQSRKASRKNDRRIVTVVLASTDGTTNVPTRGQLFGTDSGVTGRYCQEVIDDEESLYGLYTHVAQYEGFIALPGGATGEIVGSRRESDTIAGRVITLRYASTDGTSNIPAERSMLDGDGGLTGRRVVRRERTPEAIAGLWLHEIDYTAMREYVP